MSSSRRNWHTVALFRTQGGSWQLSEVEYSSEAIARRAYDRAARAMGDGGLIEVALFNASGKQIARINEGTR